MADRERLTPDQIQGLVASGLEDCRSYNEILSVERTEATRDYNGEPLGNEEEGRSQVVVTELRDAVLGVLPSLVRVLLGADHPVEFVGTRPDEGPAAEQATEYVRAIFAEENPGFRNTVAVLKDGLIRRVGIFKWYHDPSAAVKAYRMEKLLPEQVKALELDPDVTITKVIETKGQPEVTVELTKKQGDGRIVVDAVPPDEFYINREARSIETAMIAAHVRDLTKGQLLDMGIDEGFINEAMSAKAPAESLNNLEAAARRPAESDNRPDPDMGAANAKIKYCEGFFRLDVDGDGVAELRKICTVGPGYKIVPGSNIPWDHIQFSLFSPDPEPHTAIGHSWRDRLKDIQRIKTGVLRGTLDSLSLAMYPRMTYEQGYVSVADMLNTAIGAPIRMTKPGAVQEFRHVFVGADTLPFMQFMDDLTERRIGRNNGVAGLDADALQSTEKGAVQAAIQGSQEQAEMLARIFAEETLKPMFKGILTLLIKHRPRKQVVRLRGQWVELQPDAWNVNMDVRVNVALGQGFTDRKIQTMLGVAGQQKEILATYGPSNPLVSVAMFRNTIARVLMLQGVMDVDSYFKPVDPNWEPPQAPPQPTPEQILAEAEQNMAHEKTIKELAIKKDELELKRQQMEMDYTLRLKEFELRELEAHARPTEVALDEFHRNEDRRIQEAKNASDARAREEEFALKQEDLAIKREGLLIQERKIEADIGADQARMDHELEVERRRVEADTNVKMEGHRVTERVAQAKLDNDREQRTAEDKRAKEDKAAAEKKEAADKSEKAAAAGTPARLDIPALSELAQAIREKGQGNRTITVRHEAEPKEEED